MASPATDMIDPMFTIDPLPEARRAGISARMQ